MQTDYKQFVNQDRAMQECNLSGLTLRRAELDDSSTQMYKKSSDSCCESV